MKYFNIFIKISKGFEVIICGSHNYFLRPCALGFDDIRPIRSINTLYKTFFCLFGVFRSTREIFIHMDTTSPLPLKGC